MEKKVKILGIEKMFCSICEEEHNVELIEEENKLKNDYLKTENQILLFDFRSFYRCLDTNFFQRPVAAHSSRRVYLHRNPISFAR